MKKTTRREFIKKSGFTMLTVGLTGPSFFRTMNVAANSKLTQAAALSETGKILVVIQLDGGNDGLNTVIPMSGQLNSLYKQYRGTTLEIPNASILPIGADAAGNELGLHPNLQKLKALYDQGRVSVVQAVGYENQIRSHFSSQDYWHSAGQIDGTGWLGDYLDVAFPSSDNPLIAAAIGARLPLTLRADQVAVPAINGIGTYQLQTDIRFPADATNKVDTFLALNQEGASDRVLYEYVRQTALDAYESAETLQSGVANYMPDPSIVYDQANPLARGMSQAAQILGGDLGTKILYVSLGGFDTHQTQAALNDPLTGTHATLLGYLSDAVDTFYRDMERLGLADDVLIITWSEFGRKVKENGNQGTDHGAAAPQFVIGNAVNQKITGIHPSLSDLNQGLDDLKYSIDFRSVYATVLEKWLGVDSQEIIGGAYEVLEFI